MEYERDLTSFLRIIDGVGAVDSEGLFCEASLFEEAKEARQKLVESYEEASEHLMLLPRCYEDLRNTTSPDFHHLVKEILDGKGTAEKLRFKDTWTYHEKTTLWTLMVLVNWIL